MNFVKNLIIILLFTVVYAETNCATLNATSSAQYDTLSLDGNGDGILDSEQPYVITIPDAVTGKYITLVADNCPIQIASSHPNFKNTEYNFPQGIFYYELQCTEANVTIYFHGITQLQSNLVYQKYGPTTPGDLSTVNWYTLPDVAFKETTIYGQSTITANFILQDGELGDDTGVDGRIVDPGGIAYSATKQTFTEDVTILKTGSISHATFAGHVKNDGLIANSTFLEQATIVGGKLSGNIVNKGIIQDINFVGAALTGGILAGDNVNNSAVDGIIQDVKLAPQATLSGGKLGGTVDGEDCVIKDVQLEANANLTGCDLAGKITGDEKYPAQISAAKILPGATLSNMQLSPTVELASDIILGEGVILPHDPPIIEDFGLKPEAIVMMDNKRFQQLELQVFSLFTAEEIAQIPAGVFSIITGEQLTEFTVEALAGITSEQFHNLVPKTLTALTSKNMAGFSGEVISKFTLEHLEMLNPTAFQGQDSRSISKIISNLNANTIKVTDIESMLPTDWSLGKDGALITPIGTKLTAQYLSPYVNIPNINVGIGLGGQGVSIKEGLTHSLAKENLTDYVIYQQADGILIVAGIGKFAGIEYSFIPDSDNIIQIDTEKTPIGLAIDNGGFFRVTTPEGQQYKLIPVPYDPAGVAKVLNNKPIAIGKNGDVLMQIQQATRMMSYSFYVAIFDPFIESAPEDLCIEIENGELLCDFDLVPNEQRPGLHFPRERANLAFEEARMVYPDGTTQTCTPTVYSPETFIAEALRFPGVEKISFNSNGSFYVLHEGKSYILKPSFTAVETTASTPTIALNAKGGIDYSVPVELPSNTRRNAQMMLMFDLFIEPAPDNWCIEVGDGGVFCDFANVPET